MAENGEFLEKVFSLLLKSSISVGDLEVSNFESHSHRQQVRCGCAKDNSVCGDFDNVARDSTVLPNDSDDHGAL